MKRLLLPALLILLIAFCSILNSYSLTKLATELSTLLGNAQDLAESGHPIDAINLTEQAEKAFLEYSAYLHSTLNHQTIDEIHFSFSEVLEHLRSGNSDAFYAAANSALIIQLQLLAEAEKFSLNNLL